MGSSHVLPEHSTEVSDFKISSAGWQVNLLLCMLRKVLGDYLIAILTKFVHWFSLTCDVTEDCGNETSNRTACCTAMESYIVPLAKAELHNELANFVLCYIIENQILPEMCSLCHISLKDYSRVLRMNGLQLFLSLYGLGWCLKVTLLLKCHHYYFLLHFLGQTLDFFCQVCRPMLNLTCLPGSASFIDLPAPRPNTSQVSASSFKKSMSKFLHFL